jgi:hypothetical protein
LVGDVPPTFTSRRAISRSTYRLFSIEDYGAAIRIEQALNLKTAKSLGNEFSTTLFGSADFVVE